MKNNMTEYLKRLQMRPVQSYKNLSLFPLVIEKGVPEYTYMLLDQALDAGLVTITEVGESGSVPELKVSNRADRMLLLVDGEELVGAKQNRIVNTTILVAAQTAAVIPVSCCEQGRWSYNRRDFTSHCRMFSPMMRAGKAEQVRRNLEEYNGYAADQGEIWCAIEEKADRRNARSASMAMSEIYEKDLTSIREYRQHFGPVEGQVGGVFAIDGRIAGMDCFDRPETFFSLFAKLLDSYALDAIDRYESSGCGKSDNREAVTFIEHVLRAEGDCRDAVSLGMDIRFESPEVTGFALAYKGSIVHCSAFSRGNGSNGSKTRSRMQRSSRRAYRH